MNNIVEVNDKKTIQQFVFFIQKLYPKTSHYVYPFFRSLKKDLIKYVLQEKNYHAYLWMDDNIVRGRILYTFEWNPREQENVCYFSFFDFEDNLEISQGLMDKVIADMQKNQIKHMEGPYTPFDPDARRGCLTNEFDTLPTLFNTYNYEYYLSHYEALGFEKSTDALCVTTNVNQTVEQKAYRFAQFAKRSIDIECSYLDEHHLDTEIEDIGSILQEATTDINYQEAPSIDMIKQVAKTMMPFLSKDLVVIARERTTHRPIGFVLVMLDYNQVLKKMNGRFSLITFLTQKKKITRARGILQYIIPSYQSTGLIAILFHEIFHSLQKHQIKEFEGGTIMEKNTKSFSVFFHYGGHLSKRYRIYQRRINNETIH